MAEILTTVMELLCQQGTVSQCQQAIQSYPDVTQQMVFLVFFPAVFILLFIYILESGIITNTGHKKLKGVISIALFMFIVFQGWYHIFVSLSQFWFIMVIVLGGIWAVIAKMGPGSRGGGGSAVKGIVGKIAEKGADHAVKEVTKALGWESGRKKSSRKLIHKIERGEKLSAQEESLLRTLVSSLDSEKFAEAMRKNGGLSTDAAVLRDLARKEEPET